MKKDLFFTFITQFIILLSGLIVYKLAIVQYGDIGFSEFSIIKRNIAYIYTFAVIGMGVTVPKFISKEVLHGQNILVASLFIASFSIMLITAVSVLFKNEIAFLLFGNESYSRFIFPLLITIIGLILHSLVYSYYRGKMIFAYSNLLQIINIGLIPIAVFIFTKKIEDIFVYTGLGVAIVSLVSIVRILLLYKFKVDQVKSYIKKVIIYGLQRLPGDFALASLLALPSIFYAHSDDLVMAGYVAFSISILNMTAQLLSPIGIVMLSKISFLLANNDFYKINYYLKRLFMVSILFSISAITIYQYFADIILYIYLGDVALVLIDVSKNIMWGILFYPFYVIMRSIVDAYYSRAYNTISVLASLLVYIFLYIITGNNNDSFVISLAVLSLITLYLLKPLLRINR